MKSQLFSKGRLHLVSLPLTLFLLFSSGRIFANDSGEIISSPYSNCQQETITKTTIETDAEWRSAGNLALRAGQVTTRILEKNQENLEKMKECFSKTLAGDRSLPPKCEQDLQFIKKLVPAVRQARLHLAFAYSPNSQPIINLNTIDSYLNFSALTPPFLPLKEKFEPLTIDERNRIRQIFKNFLVVTKQKFETEGNKLRD